MTLVSLSATVSNAEEFADWLVTVRGDTEVVVSEHRPVPLWQHMLVGKRMFDLFHDADAARKHEVAPRAAALHPGAARRLELTRPGRGRGRPAAAARRWRPPPRADVVDRLDRDGPAAGDHCSSSAGPAATPPCSSASPPGCG